MAAKHEGSDAGVLVVEPAAPPPPGRTGAFKLHLLAGRTPAQMLALHLARSEWTDAFKVGEQCFSNVNVCMCARMPPAQILALHLVRTEWAGSF